MASNDATETTPAKDEVATNSTIDKSIVKSSTKDIQQRPIIDEKEKAVINEIINETISAKARGKRKMEKAITKKGATSSSQTTKKEAASSSQTIKKTSPYNRFMVNELKRIKDANSGIPHKKAFNMAAQNWVASPENPKNRKNKSIPESSSSSLPKQNASSSSLTIG